jgi:hypothetical protein
LCEGSRWDGLGLVETTLRFFGLGGILSFGIQCIIWIVNIIRWVVRRRTKIP